MLTDLLAKAPLFGAQLSSMAPRLAIYAFVAVAIFGTGFIKGKAWEQNVQAGAENKEIVAKLAKAQTQARLDSAASVKSAQERAALAARNQDLRSKLAAALAAKKTPVECDISEEAQATINEMLK